MLYFNAFNCALYDGFSHLGLLENGKAKTPRRQVNTQKQFVCFSCQYCFSSKFNYNILYTTKVNPFNQIFAESFFLPSSIVHPSVVSLLFFSSLIFVFSVGISPYLSVLFFCKDSFPFHFLSQSKIYSLQGEMTIDQNSNVTSPTELMRQGNYRYWNQQQVDWRTEHKFQVTISNQV